MTTTDIEVPKKKNVSVDEAYSSEPWWYDARGFLILTFAYRSTLPAQIRLFGGNMGPRHLEAAIGSGTLFDMVLRVRKWRKLPLVEVTGFDYAQKMLAGAKQRFANVPGMHLMLGDAANLSFASDSFDTENVANAIHCFSHIEGAVKELHRVLKPGGTLAGNCLLYPKGKGLLDRIANRINDWGMKKGILYRPYHAHEMRELLLKAGFRIEYEKITGNCYDFIAKKS